MIQQLRISDREHVERPHLDPPSEPTTPSADITSLSNRLNSTSTRLPENIEKFSLKRLNVTSTKYREFQMECSPSSPYLISLNPSLGQLPHRLDPPFLDPRKGLAPLGLLGRPQRLHLAPDLLVPLRLALLDRGDQGAQSVFLGPAEGGWVSNVG
jgi:hypothetical protein